MSDHVGEYLVEQIRQKDEIISSLMHAKATTWDEGFSAGMAEWHQQHQDPNHPITRINPYERRTRD